jgi:membrane-associated phospholipid phosphatase
MPLPSLRVTFMTAKWPVCVVALLFVASEASAQEPTPADASNQSTQQVENTVPLPAHTGWETFVKDTGRDFLAFPKRKSTWALLAAGGAAALAVHPADDYVESHIVGNSRANDAFKLGKWAGSVYAETGASVGLWVVGRYVLPPGEGGLRTNKVSHLGFDLMRAQVVTQTLVQGVKYAVRRDRPTGECCAFPSGHAASAFAMAAVLERHLGYRASWPALAVASYVAASRLVDNRHFLSDVVFGAALGEAVGWTVVGRHGRSQYALQPVPLPGGMMFALVRAGE